MKNTILGPQIEESMRPKMDFEKKMDDVIGTLKKKRKRKRSHTGFELAMMIQRIMYSHISKHENPNLILLGGMYNM